MVYCKGLIFLSCVSRYSLITFSFAQGVFLRKVRLELIEGSLLKQLTLILSANFPHPYSAISSKRFVFKVIPCKGLFSCSLCKWNCLLIIKKYKSNLFEMDYYCKKKPLDYSKGFVSMCSEAVALAPPIIQSCNTTKSYGELGFTCLY